MVHEGFNSWTMAVVIPVHNGEKWLEDCLSSIISQDISGISACVAIFNDASTDDTSAIIDRWSIKLTETKFSVLVTCNDSETPVGVGGAKNAAIKAVNSRCLIFQDADDVMLPGRITTQYGAIEKLAFRDMDHSNGLVLIGSKFIREPEGSTVRFTDWANGLTQDQLYYQRFTSHGPTLIAPTWCCTRKLYDTVGGFEEVPKGFPEDQVFFYKAARLNAKFHLCPEPLVMYRYHVTSASFGVSEATIWDHRVREFETQIIIPHWEAGFTIWSAGKQGKRLYRTLSPAARQLVKAFCDVDKKKITHGYYEYMDPTLPAKAPKPRVPIVHFTEAVPPFVLCVKMGLTGGGFEKNLESMKLVEGKDYYHFN